MATLYGDITSVEYQNYIIGGHPLRVPILHINTQDTVNIGDSITATNVNSYKFIWGCMALAYNTLYTIPADEKLYNRSNNGYILRTGNSIKICKANDTVITTVSMVTSGNYGFAGKITIFKLLDGFMFPIINPTNQWNKNNFDANYDVISFDLFPIIEQKNADNREYGTYYSEYAELMNFLNGSEAPTDPYSGAGDSGTGGGGGSFDDSGDDVPIPNLPTLSAANAGFITLFNPSVSQLNSLADYMWTDAAFDVANFKKIFEDPMDCILGLSIVPISVTTSGSADVAIGNMLIPSIQFPVVSSQYQEFNCGSIPLTTPFFGGYLDYEPYTKIQIVVPYCGTFQISADDVMGKTINLVYHIDVLTGSCVAMLKCGDSVLYQFNGSCAVNIPVNNISYQSTIENATRIAVAIGTTVATAGAAAPAKAAAAAPLGAATAESTAKSIAIGAALAGAAPGLAGATAEGALSMKPSIERSGALSSSTGMMSVQTPYIVITRPRLCLPKDQNKLKGYPSFITVTLGDLTGQGYTEFDSVILSGLFLTDDEKGELITLLRSGVYL